MTKVDLLSKMVQNRSILIKIRSKLDRNYIEIVMVVSTVVLEWNLYRTRCPNLESKFKSTTTNRFGDPNRLSLVDGVKNGQNFVTKYVNGPLRDIYYGVTQI